MTNFDFLLKDSQFASFSSIACLAEQLLNVDTSTCVLTCRRAMEAGVKWLYSVDDSLERPYQDNLSTLIATDDFRDLVPKDLITQMTFIRRVGNDAAHSNKKISRGMASLCLKNLLHFFDFVDFNYGTDYKPKEYVEPAEQKQQEFLLVPSEKDLTEETISLDKLIEQNESKKPVLTVRRKAQAHKYVVKALDLSEYQTRKQYIDAMLIEADWKENENWLNEYELQGMPNASKVGYADYVLFGDEGLPLAVIEAKRTSVEIEQGRQQAKIYADLLEQKFHKRPVIFLTNGFETRIWDDKYYPERNVSSIYNKRDLEKLFNLHRTRQPLNNVIVNDDIAGRYYQHGAIKAVCERFDKENRRKALLVMATGSGKTRTIIALIDALQQNGWTKNVLFLADRTALVKQAHRAFVNYLPQVPSSNICIDKDKYTANIICSTYQTIYNCIDNVRDKEGKLYSVGHFDLIVVDEAHRTIYNKYREIFDYFDAPIVGLTATPKDEVDKNTYDIFELETGVPTYGYELAQAVQDGFLVPYKTIEVGMKFIENGIAYDELTAEEKEQYEDTFEQQDGSMPDTIASTAINDWVFNEDTIKQVLEILMEKGLRIDFGNKIGKTIIFAKSHKHAEEILRVFNKQYPYLNGYAKVIDNKTNYADTVIDEFSTADKLPQIAISVDMLDTGIDVPEILNLVFFKQVFSKSKFWQMIGRGTRCCKGLLDNNEDKKEFYIFDFCNNFEFFRMNEGKEADTVVSIQSSLFVLKAKLALELQDIKYQTEELKKVRAEIVDYLVGEVKKLNKNLFSVKQHLKYVEKYSAVDSYSALQENSIQELIDHIAPFVQSIADEATALRFDHLLYKLELAFLRQESNNRACADLERKAKQLTKLGSIPDVQAQTSIIQNILADGYVESLDYNGLENIRQSLRELIKYIPKTGNVYDTDFKDEILGIDVNDGELGGTDLKNYKEKIEFYIRKHLGDDEIIQKVNNNLPLSEEDIELLNKNIITGVGIEDGNVIGVIGKPLNVFIREIVGLSREALQKAFSDFENAYNLNSKQIYFINQLIGYFQRNGFLTDKSVLMYAPFNLQGNISDIFTDMKMWADLMNVVDQLNEA